MRGVYEMKVKDTIVTAVATVLGSIHGAITVLLDGAPADEVSSATLEDFFSSRRTAVAFAKDKKAALEKEQAAINRDKAKLDRKIRKQRQRQAERIYKQRIAQGYDSTLAVMDNAALQNAKARRDAAVKALAQDNAAVEKATAAAKHAEAARIKAAKKAK